MLLILPMADDGLGFIEKLVETGSRIKFAPGVIGKGAMMWLVLIAVCGVAIWRLSVDHPVFDGVVLGAVGLLALLVRGETHKMRDYATKNPSTALLEGAELLAFQKFQARTKELPAGDKSAPASPTGEALAREEQGKPQA